MRFLGMTIERGAGKNKAPLEVKTKQPATLILAVAEHIKDHSTWALKILHVNRDTLKAAPILTTTIGEFVQVCDQVEDYIRERFGAGEFKAAIYRPNGEILASYDVPVGGPKAYKGFTISPHNGHEAERKKSASTVEDFVAMAGAMKVLMPEADTGMKDLMVELVKGQLQGGSSESDIFMRELATVSVNNAIGEKESEFDKMKSLIELTRMLAPNIPEENIATALIGALPGIAQVFATIKGGNGPPQGMMPQMAPALPPGSGDVDLDALSRFAATMPAEMITQLPADVQQAIQQLRNRKTPEAPAGVTLPRPGENVDAAGGAAPASPPVTGNAPPAAGRNPHHVAIDAQIEEIRADLRGTATDNEIAQKMLAMITAARGFTSSEPHPVLKGVMEASEKTGAAEFRRFCQAIPELGRDYERIERIEQEIVNVMQAGAAETQSALESDVTEDELNFAYETEAQERAAATEQTNVSRSTRIPEPGTEINVGAESDRDADQEARQTDQDHAKAV